MVETLSDLIKADLLRDKRNAALQEKFEDMGGVGDVFDFMQIGETKPHSGKDKHWGTLTNEEKDLWVDITKIRIIFFAPVPDYFK